MRLWHWTHPPRQAEDNQNSVQENQDYAQYTAYSQLLDRNGQWIGVADTKAGVILGFLVVIFPLLATPACTIVQKMAKAIPGHATIWAYLPATGFILLLGLFLIATLSTVLCVLMTLTPRLAHQGKPSLIFFGDIASQKYEDWQQHLCTLDPHLLAIQVLEQVYATAYIATYKHKHVRQAIRGLIVTLLVGLVLSLLSQFVS